MILACLDTSEVVEYTYGVAGKTFDACELVAGGVLKAGEYGLFVIPVW
jgi:hypothetical protein